MSAYFWNTFRGMRIIKKYFYKKWWWICSVRLYLGKWERKYMTAGKQKHSHSNMFFFQLNIIIYISWIQGCLCGLMCVKLARQWFQWNILFSGRYTLSGQRDIRFCTPDFWFCHVTVAQRTSSTLRSSALQNQKSEAQNSFGPRVASFGGWQGNGMRRTGRTPIDVNAASHQKTVPGACVPLSTEGIFARFI